MTNFQIYKAEINRLLEKTQTGGGWAVEYRTNNDIDGNAMCQYNIMQRWVTFTLNVKLCKTESRKEIEAHSKHEFGHFVTGRLERLAIYRFTNEDEIIEECERIARIFERL